MSAGAELVGSELCREAAPLLQGSEMLPEDQDVFAVTGESVLDPEHLSAGPQAIQRSPVSGRGRCPSL